jgi:hypothetical protein
MNWDILKGYWIEELKMSELKFSPSEVGWIDEDVMEGKWLVFENVFKYISRVG